MKIFLYLEFYNFFGGFLYKKVGTGLLSSYQNQKKVLKNIGVDVIERWNSSFDILQINTPWLKSLYYIWKAHRLGKKVIIWSHVTVEDAMQVFWFMPIIAPLFKKYLTYAYNQADVIFCPSTYTKKLLIAYGIPDAKIIVQTNGVDTRKHFPSESLRLSGRRQYSLNSITVGTVALAIPRKGIDTFLKLAEECAAYQFIWFGKIYSSLLVKPLPKVLPSNVVFTGYVSDVNEAYNSIDIFIFPSFEENEGMAVLEAAAVGLPIVVRNIPVYEDWLIDGVNCLKANTDKEFVAAIVRLANDNNLRDRIVANARRLAHEKSIDEISKKLHVVYQNLNNLLSS